MDTEHSLRQHLVYLLSGGGAHAGAEQVLADLAPELQGQRPQGLPYSPWELLEHLRICQKDILVFSTDPHYRQPEWPQEYWPKSAEPPDASAWDSSVAAFHADLKAMIDLVRNPETDLYARIPWGEGQTILREALLVADHNAYHLGQLITVRRLLDAWSRG